MSIFAIGDVQGCDETLARLLARLPLGGADGLWFAGDLVNRGPRSLDVLRRVRGLGERAVTVLGNHDLHLLARAEGIARPRRTETLDDVLAAPDRDELLGWLAARPFLHRDGDTVLVHAGLHPSWSLDDAEELADEARRELAGSRRRRLLELVAAGAPDWRDGLRSPERAAAVVTVLTRIRTCTEDGRACRDFSGPPGQAPPGCVPWFTLRRGAGGEGTVVFGHWAALGLHLEPGAVALDTGCVWGGSLTAVRLEDRAVFSEPSAEQPNAPER